VVGRDCDAARGREFVTGIEVEPHSHLVVERYSIAGKERPAAISYLFTEAVLGAGGSQEAWQPLRGPEFRYGLAAVASKPGRASNGTLKADDSRCGARAARSAARCKSRWTGAQWRQLICAPNGSPHRSRFGAAPV